MAAEQNGREAAGPLRVHPTNPRYFTAGYPPERSEAFRVRQRAVFLTGSHTWPNLVDMGRSDPPEAFDFDGYLGFLERYGHNFIRLWAWDSVVWDTRANGGLGKEYVHHVAPQPWVRTGPGTALDGKPRFDLKVLNPDYFSRLRSRVRAAGERGIYVSVMLFEGWGLHHANRGREAPAGWAWRGHPFHPANNVNDVDVGGDEIGAAVHRLGNPEVQAIQADYSRKVVDTVNVRDNVLYEVINEGGEKEWDWWVVRTLHEYESTRAKQHPVGITGHGAERLESMRASPAEWISPGGIDGYGDDPPAWDGRKVSLLDTDHIWGCGGNPGWVWRSFLRGHNPIFMDPYDGAVLGTPGDPRWEPIRQAMGVARRLADRVDLAALEPRDDLASSGYCLAEPGREYLVYLPDGRGGTVDLSAATGTLRVEWVDPRTGASRPGDAVDGGATRAFSGPDASDWLLRLTAASGTE